MSLSIENLIHLFKQKIKSNELIFLKFKSSLRIWIGDCVETNSFYENEKDR